MILNIDQNITFFEGEMGEYVIDINWTPIECCDRPVKIYTNSTRSQLPGIYFSVKIPNKNGLRTFDDSRDGNYISEKDTNIQIIIKYDKSITGFTENSLRDFTINLEPTCTELNPKITQIKGKIQWIIPFKCELKVDKFVLFDGKGGQLSGKLFGGRPPYAVQLQINETNSETGWKTIYADTVLTSNNNFIFNESNVSGNILSTGKYRLLGEYKNDLGENIKPLNICETVLPNAPALIFDIAPVILPNKCSKNLCAFHVSSPFAEDGTIRFNLNSNSKPIDIFWTGPYLEEPNITNVNGGYDFFSSDNLINKIITQNSTGNGNGVGDMINLSKGWYRITVRDKWGNVGVKTLELISPKIPIISLGDIEPPCKPGECNGSFKLNIQTDPECDLTPIKLNIKVNDQDDINQISTNLDRLDWDNINCEPLLNLNYGNNLKEPTIINNGNGNYDYEYDDVCAGVYNIGIEDCMGNDSNNLLFEIKDPPKLVAKIIKINSVCSCGDNNGFINLEISSGRFPITYILNNNTTVGNQITNTITSNDEQIIDKITETIDGLNSGKWILTLIENDSNAVSKDCKQTLEFEFIIKEPLELNFSLLDKRDLSCNSSNKPSGFCDGEINIINEPKCPINQNFDLIAETSVSVNWFMGNIELENNGDISIQTRKNGLIWESQISGICAGIYTAKITGKVDGCDNILTSTDLNIEILEPQNPITAVKNLVKNPSKNGAKDGLIKYTVSGGTPPYTAIFGSFPSCGEEEPKMEIGVVGNTIELMNICGNGKYKLTVSDSKGCFYTDSEIIEIVEPVKLIINKALSESSVGLGCDSGKIIIEGTGALLDNQANLTISAKGITNGNVYNTYNINESQITINNNVVKFKLVITDVKPDIYEVIIGDNVNNNISKTVIVSENNINPCENQSNLVLKVNDLVISQMSPANFDDLSQIINYINFKFDINRNSISEINNQYGTICSDNYNVCCVGFGIELEGKMKELLYISNITSMGTVEYGGDTTYPYIAYIINDNANNIGNPYNPNDNENLIVTLTLSPKEISTKLEDLNINYGNIYSGRNNSNESCVIGNNNTNPFNFKLYCIKK